jgi:hypothetical protein
MICFVIELIQEKIGFQIGFINQFSHTKGNFNSREFGAKTVVRKFLMFFGQK